MEEQVFFNFHRYYRSIVSIIESLSERYWSDPVLLFYVFYPIYIDRKKKYIYVYFRA